MNVYWKIPMNAIMYGHLRLRVTFDMDSIFFHIFFFHWNIYVMIEPILCV